MTQRLQQPTRRQGAVLVLVIVLLVLMAMMGVAYMASARSDRAASTQNIVNTQIELLLDGARNIANASLISDVMPPGRGYRPINDPNYEHYDSIAGDRDPHLASRTPTTLAEAARPFAGVPGVAGEILSEGGLYYLVIADGGDPTTGTGVVLLTGADPDGNWMTPGPPLTDVAVFWPAVSLPAGLNVANPAPNAIDRVRMWNGAIQEGAPLRQGSLLDLRRRPMFPIEVRVGGVLMPGMRVYDGAGQPHDLVAADTDRDGIADALMFDLDFEQNGVRYFAALRIIDHNSALNITVAGERDGQDLFPTTTDLMSFLHPYDADPTLNNPTNYQVLLRELCGGGPPQLTVMEQELPQGGRRLLTGFVYRTLADYLWMRNGRGIDRPDLIGSLPAADTPALARRFVLSNKPALARSESFLPNTLRSAGADPAVPTQLVPYDPVDVGQWYAHNFLEGNTASLRALAVTRNPVVNAAMAKSVGSAADPPRRYDQLMEGPELEVMPPYPSIPSIAVKANVNTADFSTLWQAYWSVMVGSNPNDRLASRPHDDVYDDTAPTGPGSPTGPRVAGKMFRDVDRVDRSHFEAVNNPQDIVGMAVPSMVLLRSALAAVNTIDLRDVDDDVTVKEFEHIATAQGGNRRIRVYGYEPQPFITEWVVYKNYELDEQPQPDGAILVTAQPRHFVAVELFNPYDRPLSLRDYALATVDKWTTWPRELRPLFTEADWNAAVGAALGDPANVMIPPLGRIVLHNHDAASEDHNVLPASSTLLSEIPGGTPVVFVPNLGDAVGLELVVLRPRMAGQLQPDEAGDTPVALANRVPIDQMDLTGIVYPDNIFKPADETGVRPNNFPLWHHYARPNDNPALWQFVFPGRYTAYMPIPPSEADPNPVQTTQPRTGFERVQLRYEGMTESETPPAAAALGLPDPGTIAMKFSIPLSVTGSAGPATLDGNPVTNTSSLAYPFGGFARNGDILQVPFIGRYRIQYMGGPSPAGGDAPANPPGFFAELNSITMDAAYADDMNPANDADEQVGRFVPLFDATRATDPDYGWAASLFDYLTVQAPHADFMPEMSAEAYRSLVTRLTGAPPLSEPVPVRNAHYAANSDAELFVGVEGLVNLNTADWRVIARLPLLPMHLPNWQQRQADLAKAIVRYRDTHGPFQTLFDLNRVPGFQDAMGDWRATQFTSADGDLTVLAGTPDDGMLATYEDRNFMLTRISNHVTLRSDSYTVYVHVQGWRDVDSPNARLVAERRDAYTVDRTRVRPESPTLIIRHISQD